MSETTSISPFIQNDKPSSEQNLLERYRTVRKQTEALCQPLSAEDCALQSMPDCSPVRWHLAHTTWFFETFLLKQKEAGYKPYHPAFEYLFNSYYNAIGEQFPREERGLLSRPFLQEILAYRRHVDNEMSDWLESSFPFDEKLQSVLVVGLQHEQQHQELILTDVKHLFSRNPLQPAYQSSTHHQQPPVKDVPAWQWISGKGGLVEVGHEGNGFAFDNEFPRHQTFLQPYALASRLVTNGEYLAFVEEGGYKRPELWLSLGWTAVQNGHWQGPLYWRKKNNQWLEFTLTGLRPLHLAEPVCHISYFEADAFARWSGKRLPTEQEWEVAAVDQQENAALTTAEMANQYPGNFVEEQHWHPQPAPDHTGLGLQQLWGDVWEWTCSSYSAYPGYRAPEGAIGEYNGKFMCNQFVLRGGSCATPQSHIRATYRNFFDPASRWQFTGIRLAD